MDSVSGPWPSSLSGKQCLASALPARTLLSFPSPALGGAPSSESSHLPRGREGHIAGDVPAQNGYPSILSHPKRHASRQGTRSYSLLHPPSVFHFLGGAGGGSVGFPRAWLRSSAMKCFKKLPALLGSARGKMCQRLGWSSASASHTCCLALAQRLARIAAIAEVLDSAMDSADAPVEGWAAEELSRGASQPRAGRG
jgi:hypothetical protein